jgi:hypothetical protein
MPFALATIRGTQIYDCASHSIRIEACRLQRREMIKKILDVISLASIAVIIGVVVWLAIWGESPRAPGHLSIQSKILGWDAAPVVFGVNWLIIRYAKASAKRFPRVFGHRGLLFYFALVLAGVVLLERLFLILSKLAGG